MTILQTGSIPLIRPTPSRTVGRPDVLPTNNYFVVAEAAGDIYVDLTGVLKPGVHNMGLQIQPMGASVIPAGTLCYPADVEANPANAPWHVFPSVPNQKMFNFMPATPIVLRLTFSGKGRCYIGAF